MENKEQPKPKRRYKKRTKKVTPTVGVLTGSSKEVRDIPMYDPYTGEANPHYEELTGKPNPLMRPKRSTIDGVADKARKELGLPIMNKMIEVEPKTQYSDLKTNTRFLVIFPEDFNIKPFQVKSITRPSLTINKKTFMGVKYGTTAEVSTVSIEFIDFINDSMRLNEKLYEVLKDYKMFNFTIQILNPNNIVIEEILLGGCFITKIDFSPLSYGDDTYSTTTIEIQPKDYRNK
jgi:hypothetical protein